MQAHTHTRRAAAAAHARVRSARTAGSSALHRSLPPMAVSPTGRRARLSEWTNGCRKAMQLPRRSLIASRRRRCCVAAVRRGVPRVQENEPQRVAGASLPLNPRPYPPVRAPVAATAPLVLAALTASGDCCAARCDHERAEPDGAAASDSYRPAVAACACARVCMCASERVATGARVCVRSRARACLCICRRCRA